ncbi:Hydroxyacylglutathione hydrolase, mitochondrial [Lamellibrachia satsuma]|nr:Hydroxyacylglutathione hydrolase, mitochondrial [Lamellibrachia satsuma]
MFCLGRTVKLAIRITKLNLLGGGYSTRTSLQRQRTSSYSRKHSSGSIFHLKNMNIHVLSALDDNYMYLLVDERTKQAAAIDPVEPEKLIEAVKEADVNLIAILTTHHHSDHAGGNERLVKMVPGLRVYGAGDRIEALNYPLNDGDEFQIGTLRVQCMATPCHTSEHLCYYVTTSDRKERPVVFTGDTLFVGGCGRFFEGTAEQMYHALVTVLSALPDHTRVFCGHEYTVSNLKFAQHVDGKNLAVKEKLAWALEMRNNGLPTIPSTIGEEISYNPFMRVEKEAVQKHVGKTDAVSTMAALRKEKNNFTAT